MVDYRKLFEAEEKLGGRFELASLLQKRAVELMRGDRPLVETDRTSWIEIATEEILAGKVKLVPYMATEPPPEVEEDEES